MEQMEQREYKYPRKSVYCVESESNKSHIAAHLPHTHVFLFCIETNTILCAL